MYKKVVIGVSVIAVIAVIFPDRTVDNNSPVPLVASGNIEIVQALSQTSPEYIDLLPPELTAKAVLALDTRTGTNFYARNFDVRLPIASLTKLMTAMVVLDHKNKNDVVVVQKSDIVPGTKMGLKEGEKVTVENLLKGMLIPSGNDAARALARHVGGDQAEFVDLMNEKVRNLGLADTNFTNAVGFDSPNNYSTALDLARITDEFMKYSLLAEIVDIKSETVTSVDGQFAHELVTSNKLLLENSDVVGVKTGYTAEAQGNLIVKINHDNVDVLTIVLNTPDREADSRKLIDWIFQAYRW